MTNYWTGLDRFEGSFLGSHNLAYAMLFFSFIYCLLNRTYQFSSRLSKSGLAVFQLLAIFCLYKSYTRTAIIGFIIFWLIYLWGSHKKHFFLAIFACSFLAIVAFPKAGAIFWQTGQHGQTGQHDLDAASSGRITIWHHNLKVFVNSEFPQKLIGRGLGIESRPSTHPENAVWEPHNNFLNLLMSLGVIGLFLYLILLITLLWDVYNSGLDKGLKSIFVGILFSVAAMSFLSNAVIFRVELSQYFWLFMGFFYFEKEIIKRPL